MREHLASPGRTSFTRTAIALAVAVGLTGCGGSDDDADLSWVEQIPLALAAVEDELGAGQEYFEVTASPQLTNVFVAVHDADGEATAAIPLVFVDDELQPPAPTLEGTGFTFVADAVDFDVEAILGEIADAVPDSTIESLSVVGTEGGGVRYTAAVRAAAGGLLDVTVAADGSVLEVDPV